MMMITPHRHKRRTPTVFYLAGSGLIILILFFTPFPKFIAATAQYVGIPLLRIESAFLDFMSPLSTYMSSKSGLEARIKELESENQALVHDGLLGKYLFFENQQLRMALGRDEVATHGTVAAILAGPPHSPYDTFIIDAGSNRGIRAGSMVLTPDGSGLGTIAKVFEKSSVVTLFSSPNQEIRVTLGTSTPHSIKANGRGGGQFELKLPREMEVAVGDPVLLPGTPVLLLGSVEKIVSDSTSAFQSILFSYPLNIFSLRTVVVTDVPPISHAWNEPTASIRETPSP